MSNTNDTKSWHYIEDEDLWMTPRMRTTFVALLRKFLAKKYAGQTAPNGQPNEGEWTVSGMFDPSKTGNMKEIKDAVNAVARTKKPKTDVFSDQKKLNNGIGSPFLKAEDHVETVTSKGVEVDLDGWLTMKANGFQARPVVRDSKGEIIDPSDLTEEEVYSGRWMRLLVRPAYSDKPTDRVKFYLEGVQLLAHDDAIGSMKRTDGGAFGAVDDEDEDDDI